MKLLFLAAIIISGTARAQFYVAGSELFPPSMVLLDQYQSLAGRGFEHWENKWDGNNPYTRVVLIRDLKGSVFHILYQEDFSGRLSFFAYSKNLARVFERQDKPMVQFDHCIKERIGVLKVFNEVNVVIDCFMQRLAYCSD